MYIVYLIIITAVHLYPKYSKQWGIEGYHVNQGRYKKLTAVSNFCILKILPETTIRWLDIHPLKYPVNKALKTKDIGRPADKGELVLVMINQQYY